MKTARLVSKGHAFLHQVQSKLLPRKQKADTYCLRLKLLSFKRLTICKVQNIIRKQYEQEQSNFDK